MKIALITYDAIQSYGALSGGEDTVLVEYLTAQGLHLTPEVWDNPAVDWTQYDLALFKSPWDYFDKFKAFTAWLNQVEALGLRTLNPLSTIRWNADKKYLLKIAAAGLPVVPTQLLPRSQPVALESYFTRFGTEKIIVKPSVSGGAKNTLVVARKDVPTVLPTLQNLLAEEDYLVQPFMPQVQLEGEWSFLFFNGQYSHTVLKSAKAGDFRVQHFFGGTIQPKPAPSHLLPQAQEFVDQFAPGCLYARVDGIDVNGELQLMELELVEPFLFLHTHAPALENYYRGLKQLL